MNNHNLVKFLVMGMMLEYARINNLDIDADHYQHYIESTLNKCANLAHNPGKARLPNASFSDWQVQVWSTVHHVMIKMGA